jgi:hypothetical protein
VLPKVSTTKWFRFFEALQGLSGKAGAGNKQLEAENDRLKRIVAEKELELDLAKKVRRL